jgi:hypothetical protein
MLMIRFLGLELVVTFDLSASAVLKRLNPIFANADSVVSVKTSRSTAIPGLPYRCFKPR